MGPGKGMYILRIWIDGPYGVNTTSVETWMGYDYTAIRLYVG